MSREKQNEKQAIEEMRKDLIDIFDEEYEKRRLITPQNTAEKMTAKGYRKQSEGDF
jgi:ribosomal protein S25